MCGRFTLTTSQLPTLAADLGAEVAPDAAPLYQPHWNIAPTQATWIATLERGVKRLIPARFGIAAAGGRLIINARSETAATLHLFRDAFRQSRCIVPADGFYEWKGPRGDRRPVWFHAPAGGLLRFAGLAFEHDGAFAFVILTTAPNALVRPFHDRMPAILSPAEADAWLERPDQRILVPTPDSCLASREVSLLVNDVGNDGPELLQKPAPKKQLTLV